MPVARYDGIAEWYDSFAEPRFAPALAALLGPGTGPCLDIGCGTGHYFPAIRSTGRTVVGLDISLDQLRIAKSRECDVVHASAARLPFTDGVFPTVTMVWATTDIDDFSAAVREIVRVLRPGGRLVVLGVHPCFNGPCVERGPDDSQIVHPTYRQAERHLDAPWWGRDGIRHRVGGMRHIPLAELLTTITSSGLRIGTVDEPGDDAIPVALAFDAFRD
jgi:ubiquinone/menaquinone biosynthesis C-methylase UbiE